MRKKEPKQKLMSRIANGSCTGNNKIVIDSLDFFFVSLPLSIFPLPSHFVMKSNKFETLKVRRGIPIQARNGHTSMNKFLIHQIVYGDHSFFVQLPIHTYIYIDFIGTYELYAQCDMEKSYFPTTMVTKNCTYVCYH